MYLNNFVIINNQDTFINQTRVLLHQLMNLIIIQNILRKKLKILNVNNYKNFYKKVPIKLIKLDDYIEKNKITKIDILKIDTEGFELNVIKGLKLNNNKVKYIYFEHHYDDMIKKNYIFQT